MKNTQQEQQIIQQVHAWLEGFIIKSNICPFAKREFDSQRIYYAVSDAESEIDLLLELEKQIAFLQNSNQYVTSLLIHPFVLTEFADYNQFLNTVDEYLEASGLLDEFQVASFHPDYQFAGTQAEDVENYSNRSPFPILHILDQKQVSQALQSYPDIENLANRNIEMLNKLGLETVVKLIACK